MFHFCLSSIKTCLCFVICGAQLATLSSCSDNDKSDTTTVNNISQVSLIPLPTSLEYGKSNIELPSEITISKDIEGMPSTLLESTLNGVVSSVSQAANDDAFVRLTVDNSLAEEGYTLSVEDSGINIGYADAKGLLWAVQTLRQILLQNVSSSGRKLIPALNIKDSPKKEWRGFHIDVARHMFTMDFLEKVVDCLSFYKINRLQIHLTDDQGWRVEIKKYPDLTTIGGWRTFDEYDEQCNRLAQTDTDYAIDSRFVRNSNEYGGSYTQEEISGLITYASERGIEVIPEIDMPGHFSAAIKVYPNLSCTGEAGWGEEFSYPICAGKTQNYPFLEEIWDEIIALFPSEYVHIGADEIEKDIWETCPYCQALIKELGLKNTDGLQNYFVKYMADYIKSKGKKVMAWDDAFIKDDPQDLLYTYWRDWLPSQPSSITQAGLPLVFMDWGHFYLSADVSDAQLQSLYEFTLEPQFSGIVDGELLGYQACVWTEMIPNEKMFGLHVFPSLQAFSELAWGSQRSWSSFKERIPWHISWVNSNGIHSRTPDFL